MANPFGFDLTGRTVRLRPDNPEAKTNPVFVILGGPGASPVAHGAMCSGFFEPPGLRYGRGRIHAWDILAIND